jgi:DNA-binding transcriptional LysR family regulator
MPQNQSDILLRRGLKLAHLRVLAALGRSGQVSAAAASLSISQPAASRLLAEAQRIAGAELYRRHPRGIELTEAGRHLADLSMRLTGELDAAAREIEEMGEGRSGTVAVGAVTGAAVELVLPALQAIRDSRPGIRASVVVDTSDRMAPMLLSGDLDFYIGRIPSGTDRAAFAAEPIGPEPVALIVREGHPLAGRAGVTLTDCVAFDWVLQPPGGLMRHTVEDYLMARGVPLPGRVLSTSSTLMTLALIASSDAIAPLARAAARFFSSPRGLGGRIAALPVADDLRVSPYSLLRPAARPLSPAARLVHAELARRIEAMRAAGSIPLTAPEFGS